MNTNWTKKTSRLMDEHNTILYLDHRNSWRIDWSYVRAEVRGWKIPWTKGYEPTPRAIVVIVRVQSSRSRWLLRNKFRTPTRVRVRTTLLNASRKAEFEFYFFVFIKLTRPTKNSGRGAMRDTEESRGSPSKRFREDRDSVRTKRENGAWVPPGDVLYIKRSPKSPTS